MRVSSQVTKQNPRPRKHASAAARQAAYRARNEMLEFRAEPKTAETLTRIADTIDVSRSDLLLSMVKYALANHDWARFGLTHKTIPYYQGNPIMATKKPTPAQLDARARFAEMARSGAFKKKRKANPRKKTVSQKVSQLVHEGYPQRQAVAVALSEQRAGKVKRNPIKNEQHLFGNKYATIRQDGDGRFVAQIYEKINTGAGEEIDYWGSRYYKTHAGAQRYLDSLKPVKQNPITKAKAKTSGKVSAVVLMKNPVNAFPYVVEYFSMISMAKKNTKHEWVKKAAFKTKAEAVDFAKLFAVTYPDLKIRVVKA